MNSWIALGGLYADSNRIEDSKTAYEKVVELDPENAHKAFYNLGVILTRKAPSAAQSKRAAEAFKRAVEIKPDYKEAWQQRAFALLGTGDLAGAAQCLEKYIELAPDAPDVDAMKSMLAGLK